MSAEELGAFERQASELIAAAKGLLAEFEGRLGEAIHAQRVSASEARAESVRVTRQLADLGRNAEELVRRHRELIDQIARDWQLKIEENAQRAGEAQAQAFGERIAAGLEARLAELADEVEHATRRLSWKMTLRWVLALATALPLAIVLGLSAFMPRPANPSIPGLTAAQAHAVLSRITLCWPKSSDVRDAHVCVATDDPPRMARGPHRQAVVVVRGM